VRHWAALLLLALALAACRTAAPPPLTLPAQEPPGSGSAPPVFDPQRALEHVRHLADSIGPRPAGSAAEEQAARYIAQVLESYGYRVEEQSFAIRPTLTREAELRLRSPVARSVDALAIVFSPPGQAEAELVYAGQGQLPEFPANTPGRIALVQRGGITFAEKVGNAFRAGAVGVIIYNNQPGPFLGVMPQGAALPAVAISQQEGQALLQMLAQGPVRAFLRVAEPAVKTSYNVVAGPAEGPCRLVVGGHYDSVPISPGANDNASGTAVVLELARVLAGDPRREGVCFVLFGSEEEGLLGSREFIGRLGPEERARLLAMVNLDMVGVGDRWLIVGSASLAQEAARTAEALGLAYQVGQLPRGFSSDHASFLEAGIAAVFLHRQDDPRYHSPEDMSLYVEARALEEAARLSLAVIDAVLGVGRPALVPTLP
jgi:aminopeptidase YwaD